MPHSTLEEMNAIEMEAQAVQTEYQEKIEDARAKMEQKLKDATGAFDVETKQMIAQARQHFDEQEQQAKEKLAQRVQENEAQLQKALGDKREYLINQIVERVVKEYGN
ncbi:hypothetical protein ACWOA6_07700 [Globicatella sulfidifaciens]|uniref:V/A-type H+-transporting ATPase subunit G/H n=1 Tax=Globicatella sulfidifaciens DSM 15739 TaxID=1121925 RepID=A0A1T4M8F3_9LACT|nr:hypothetical protein [Globicatella sulfidifaciens]SJZ63117.1 hypothetical protein SAMN02746011_01338 [Globicatella sulfidifaciens DSM 15739]